MKTVITMVFLSFAMYVGAQPITSTTTYKDWFDAGKMKLSVGKYTLAINDFNKSLALNPSAAEAYLQRGIAKMKNGDNENAATDFTQVIRLQAGSAEAYAYRGQIKQNKGDFQGAMYDINKAIASNSTNADYYIFRSQVSDKMGLTVQAEADRQEAAKMGGSKMIVTTPTSAPEKTEQPKPTAKEMTVKTETVPAAVTPQVVTVKTIPTQTPKQVKAADALPEVADATTAGENETTPPTRRRRMDDDQALQPKNDRVATAEEIRAQKIDIAKKENAAKAAAIQQKKTNLTIEEKAGKNEAPKAVTPPKEVKVEPKTIKVEASRAVEKVAEKIEMQKKETPKAVEKVAEKVTEMPKKEVAAAVVAPKAIEKVVEKVAVPVKVMEAPKPAENKEILASVEVEYLGSTSYTEGGGAAATKGSSPSGRQGEETKKAETPPQKPKAPAFTPQPAKGDKQPESKSAESNKSTDAAKAKVEQLGVSPNAKPIVEVAKPNSTAPEKVNEADIKRSLFNEARRRATADNHKGAIEELDKLIAMDDKNAAAYLNRAISRNQILDFHAALEDVDKAIALAPNMPEAHYNKANIYFDLQQFKDAINSYTTAVEMKKDYVAAYLNRALAKRALGGEYNPCDDWYQAKELGSVKGRKMFESLCGDYEVTTSVTAKKTDK